MSPIEAVAKALFEDMKRNGGTYEASWEDSPKELQDTFLRKARIALDALAENVSEKMVVAMRVSTYEDEKLEAAIRAAGEE